MNLNRNSVLFAIFSLTFWVFSMPGPALADGNTDADPDAQISIQASYDAEDNGMQMRDVDQALTYHAVDCVTIDPKGHEHTMDDLRGSLTKSFATPVTEAQYSTEMIDITLNAAGTEATVFVKRHSSVTVTKSAETVQKDVLWRDFWVKTASGWLLKRDREMPTTEPTPPPQPPPAAVKPAPKKK